MHISVIGSPGSGKTTVFKALGGPGAESVAVIDVPDERVDRLARIFNPRKTLYARITVVDTVAIEEGNVKSETINARSLKEMRESDAFLLVLRNFDNGQPVDPSREFLTILQEFVFADMLQVENRLERIRRQAGKKENPGLIREEASLTECLHHLADGKPLSTLPLFHRDGKHLSGFRFLSQKPLMVVINGAEETVGAIDKIGSGLGPYIPEHVPVIAACGSLEAELRSMTPEDQEIFMKEYRITESVASRIVRLAFETLGLISFLTVGDDECRAWPVRKGLSAQEAAAAIHSDLAQRFIRAETVSYEDFMRLGGFASCKKAGLWRLEGKGYIVQDGDILSIRAGN